MSIREKKVKNKHKSKREHGKMGEKEMSTHLVSRK